MQTWEYKIAYVDYRGRISVEGQESHIGAERKTAFVRHFLDARRGRLGAGQHSARQPAGSLLRPEAAGPRGHWRHR